MNSKMKEMHSETNKQLDDLFGGMFKGVADTIFQAVELSGLGWYLIGFGSLLLITTALIPNPKNN
jgi:hypothetical protein